MKKTSHYYNGLNQLHPCTYTTLASFIISNLPAFRLEVMIEGMTCNLTRQYRTAYENRLFDFLIDKRNSLF